MNQASQEKKYTLSNQGDQARNARRVFGRLLTYASRKKWPVLGALVLTALATLITVATPSILGRITNSLAATVTGRLRGEDLAVDYATIFKIVGFLAGLYLFHTVFTYLQNILIGQVSQEIVYEMRAQLDQKLNHLPIPFFDYNQTGNIISRVTSDINLIANSFQQALTTLLGALVQMVGITYMMLKISGRLSLIVFFIIPLASLAVKTIAQRSRHYFKRQQDTIGDISSDIEEVYGAHTLVKAYGLEGENQARFDQLNQRMNRASHQANFYSGLVMPVMNFINQSAYVLVSLLGGTMVYRGQLAVGSMQAFIQYSRNFTEPINNIAQIMNMIQQTLAAAERVFEVLDQEEEKETGQAQLAQPVRGLVEFKGVEFGYSDEEILLRDLSLQAQPQAMVAIVGPTGAGKSTLVNLLMRFYDISGGDILIDGQSIYDLTRREVRENFAMVLQDAWIFNGSIRDNIAYGLDVSDDQVIQAARAAQADHFIRTLPQGYDTILNEEASNISQGQRQLLTIARAFLAQKNMLILDEATSSVDTRTEALIKVAMDRLMEGKTSFVIAHRLSTIVNADLILVLDQGRIIETGSHQELLAQGGFYADLYQAQFNHD